MLRSNSPAARRRRRGDRGRSLTFPQELPDRGWRPEHGLWSPPCPPARHRPALRRRSGAGACRHFVRAATEPAALLGFRFPAFRPRQHDAVDADRGRAVWSDAARSGKSPATSCGAHAADLTLACRALSLMRSCAALEPSRRGKVAPSRAAGRGANRAASTRRVRRRAAATCAGAVLLSRLPRLIRRRSASSWSTRRTASPVGHDFRPTIPSVRRRAMAGSDASWPRRRTRRHRSRRHRRAPRAARAVGRDRVRPASTVLRGGPCATKDAGHRGMRARPIRRVCRDRNRARGVVRKLSACCLRSSFCRFSPTSWAAARRARQAQRRFMYGEVTSSSRRTRSALAERRVRTVLPRVVRAHRGVLPEAARGRDCKPRSAAVASARDKGCSVLHERSRSSMPALKASRGIVRAARPVGERASRAAGDEVRRAVSLSRSRRCDDDACCERRHLARIGVGASPSSPDASWDG